MGGANPAKVFNAQERFKEVNGINDDGTKKKRMGGLSRNKDYGSSKKPYPSVNKKDFAGGGRSYPIPTRADADVLVHPRVAALLLLGLCGIFPALRLTFRCVAFGCLCLCGIIRASYIVNSGVK